MTTHDTEFTVNFMHPLGRLGTKKKQLQETVRSTLLLWCFYLLYMLYSNLSRMYCL